MCPEWGTGHQHAPDVVFYLRREVKHIRRTKVLAKDKWSHGGCQLHQTSNISIRTSLNLMSAAKALTLHKGIWCLTSMSLLLAIAIKHSNIDINTNYSIIHSDSNASFTGVKDFNERSTSHFTCSFNDNHQLTVNNEIWIWYPKNRS